MKRLSVISAAALVAACIFLSCTKESIKNLYNSQEQRIETIVNNIINSDTTGTAYNVSNSGVQRVVLAEGTGEALTSSGTVTFYYAGYTLPSASLSQNNLFDTNIYDIAKSADRDTTDLSVFEPYTVKLSGSRLVPGLKKGLVGVKAGEQCFVLFSGKYGFGDIELGTIPANSALAYALIIVNVGQAD